MTQTRIVLGHNLNVVDKTAFLKRWWPRRMALELAPFYQWQMNAPTAAGGLDQSLLVLSPQDEIVGYLGVTPFRFHTKHGKIVNAAVTTNIIIIPEMRNSMLAWQMIKKVMDEYDVMIGMNLNGVSRAIMRRLGHFVINSIERMIRIYRIAPFAEMIKMDAAAMSAINLQKPNYKEPSVGHAQADHEHLRKLFANYHMPGINHVDRSYQYLEWRYLRHPQYQYELIIIAPDDLTRTLLMAIRIEEHRDFRIAHVTDILPLGNDLPPYGVFLDYYAKERQLDMIDAMISLPMITAPLWRAGWLSTVNDVEIRIPHLFNPVEMREPPTGNLAVWQKPHVPFLGNLGELYISKSDGDYDRPTIGAVP